jgi:Ni/Co efflux regulator RcnB
MARPRLAPILVGSALLALGGALVALAVFAGPSVADDSSLVLASQDKEKEKDKHKENDRDDKADRDGDNIARDIITDIERVILGDYARRYGRLGLTNVDRACLPPGLAKRDELPPGLQMQLQRFGRLPPGLDKCDLAPDLLGQLPARNPRHKLIAVGSDVLLVDLATRVILDVLHGALTRP